LSHAYTPCTDYHDRLLGQLNSYHPGDSFLCGYYCTLPHTLPFPTYLFANSHLPMYSVVVAISSPPSITKITTVQPFVPNGTTTASADFLQFNPPSLTRLFL